jgi:hypothetical protein
VQMARLLHGSRSLGAERSYLTHTLPRALLRDLSGAVSPRDAARPARVTHAARAATVVVAVAAAAVGGAVETLGTGWRERRPGWVERDAAKQPARDRAAGRSDRGSRPHGGDHADPARAD